MDSGKNRFTAAPRKTLPTVAHVMRAYLARSETFVQNQITTLRRYRPIVVCHHLRQGNEFSYEEGATAYDLLSEPVGRVDRLAYRAARFTLPQTSAALARYARAQNAELLHYHFLTDARFLLGVKEKTQLPAVVSAYGYDVSSFPTAFGGLGLRYIRTVFDRVECVIAMTDDMKHDLEALGCPEAQIRVHYHGINTVRFRYPERAYTVEEPLTIFSCGRFIPKKGHSVLLEALHRVDPQAKRFKVVLVGAGPRRPHLQHLVRSYGWENRVSFLGELPHTSTELIDHYRKADIFSLPSMAAGGEKEGIPGTIVEAMASGLPVASTEHAGIPAVIESGKHGLLGPEGDVSALAEALDQLIGDPDLRARLGQAAARRAAEELDLGQRTAALEMIYDEILGRSS
jgi:colanic acid/amylovoran biosynthesis glycosyltransferase